jgi:two-component sensor histidine kinase
LAVHELATNAVKYGALSVPEGNVTVSWALEENGSGEQLILHWVEQNGPPVTAPNVRGFGSILIERALAHDMSAQAKIDFLPDGVRATVQAPIRIDQSAAAVSVAA